MGITDLLQAAKREIVLLFVIDEKAFDRRPIRSSGDGSRVSQS